MRRWSASAAKSRPTSAAPPPRCGDSTNDRGDSKPTTKGGAAWALPDHPPSGPTGCVNTPPSLATQEDLALMSDRRESTAPAPPPAVFDEGDGFRETWLRYFTRPEDEAALRHVSRLLHELILDFRPYLPRPEESDTRCELAAAGRDLRYLAGYLAAIAGERQSCELTDDDTRLSELADRLFAVVEQTACEIEAALSEVAP